jgi:hypothetical protein
LVENGIVGLLLYLGMFFAVFVKLLSLPRLERRFSLVLLATLGVAMLPLGWEDRKPVWFILGTLAAMSQGQLVGMARAAWQQGVRQPAPLGPPTQRRPLTVPVQRAGRNHPR